MSELFASIKAFIEKVNLIVSLLSIAVAILVYKIWLPDILWAVFAFSLSYCLIAGIHKLIAYLYNERRTKIEVEKHNKKIAKEKQEKEEQTKAHLCTIYESLSDDVKKGMIILYRMPEPEGGFKNARILNEDYENYQFVWSAICIVYAKNFNKPYVYREDMLNKSIIHIDPDFYSVLEEKSKTFEF